MNQLPPEILRYGGIALAIVTVVSVVGKLLQKRPEPSYMEKRTCPSCGFTGSVSKHKPKCNKCGTAL